MQRKFGNKGKGFYMFFTAYMELWHFRLGLQGSLVVGE